MKKAYSLIVIAFLMFMSFIFSSCGTGGTQIPTTEPTLIDYQCAISGGDLIDRAFYITAYPGTTLSTVTLYFSARDTNPHTIQLQALDSAFNGTLIGQASASFTSATGVVTDETAVTFDFGNVAVTKGDVVAFIMTETPVSSGDVYFCNDGTVTNPPSIVTETSDSSPPLSTSRNGSIGITVTGEY